jgi:NTP pyrophosphatase (non-canonical NTP hydrolase)
MMTNSEDALRDLAHSTSEFYARFGVEPQIEACIQNFKEEVDELIEAAQRGTDKNHIAEEAADVFVTAIGLCFAADIDLEQLIEQIYAVIAKNDAKTHLTHVYSDGKIRRRPPNLT